jgi:uncharacterized protein with HEPN domain
MNARDKVLLRDMLDTAMQAQTFIDGKTRADLEANNMLIGFALVRAIEVIGEAASKISPETREKQNIIPWKNIVGMRNRLIHDYSHVNYDIVWDVVTLQISELIPELRRILSDSHDVDVKEDMS